MREFTCAQCGGRGFRETGDYNRKIAAGSPLNCSRECFFAAMRERGDARKGARSRECETCGKSFTPRQVQIDNGGGRFCSQKCNKPFHQAGQRPEVWDRRVVTMREKRARGEWNVPRGESSHQWKGGKAEAKRRRVESGKDLEGARAWRKRNPDKVREFCRRRRGRLLGRLERGTIPRIRALQRNKCAICRRVLPKGYHVDHIVPIAKGGLHQAANIQLLCPTCNMRKSDRDPIVHMQSLGRLL